MRLPALPGDAKFALINVLKQSVSQWLIADPPTESATFSASIAKVFCGILAKLAYGGCSD
jgi:hypothetical protein